MHKSASDLDMLAVFEPQHQALDIKISCCKELSFIFQNFRVQTSLYPGVFWASYEGDFMYLPVTIPLPATEVLGEMLAK